MPEIFFLFSQNDPCLANITFTFGACLVENRKYLHDENLELILEKTKIDTSSCSRFYVLPEIALTRDVVLGKTNQSSEDFRYILDRVGAAAIDLTLYRIPAAGEVAVGSLALHARIYPSDSGTLQPTATTFVDLFRKIRKYIRQSAKQVSNSRLPKTVFAFPGALAIMQSDPSRSPWPSLSIPTTDCRH